MTTMMAKLEGLLFISGDEGMTVGELAALTGMMKPAVNQTLVRLNEKYAADPDSALTILKSNETVRLATKATLADTVKRYFEAPSSTGLSQASLEVLAIIAYHQRLLGLRLMRSGGSKVQGRSTN